MVLRVLLAAVLAARSFEAVSIQPSRPGAAVQDMRIEFPPGRMEARNITLSELLGAFSGFSGRVEGGPNWVRSDRFDVIAKADGAIAPEERGPMLMAVLEDRFRLAAHHESREEAGIALRAGKEMAGLKPSGGGEMVMGRLDERRQVVFRNVPMAQFAVYLRGMLQVPVVDRTGLQGSYDFDVKPEGDAGEAFRDRIRSGVEEFGFRLEPTRVQRDVTVIDRVERPSEN
jgi:uncharacterized protein (TIGR03435 family)